MKESSDGRKRCRMKNLKSVVHPTLFLLTATSTSNISVEWVQTKGSFGGQVYALASSGRYLFAGTNGGGVFLSTNSGTSWTDMSTLQMNNSIISLAVSGSYLFAGTDGHGFCGRSANNGNAASGVAHRYDPRRL